MENKTAQKKVYLISGLGADSRLFKYQYQLDYDFHKIEWIRAKRGESLAAYAKRLSAGIDESEPYSIVGCRSEEHTSELQSRRNLVCRLLLEKKNKKYRT